MTKAQLAKQEKARQELLVALHTLRLLVKEVGGNYIAGLQADVAHVEEAARQFRNDDTCDAKQAVQMAAMLRLINKLDVKPQKGRRRDLKTLDKLVEKLTDTVDTW
jgi:uncharacterized protein (DUF2342 family)